MGRSLMRMNVRAALVGDTRCSPRTVVRTFVVPLSSSRTAAYESFFEYRRPYIRYSPFLFSNGRIPSKAVRGDRRERAAIHTVRIPEAGFKRSPVPACPAGEGGGGRGGVAALPPGALGHCRRRMSTQAARSEGG